MVSTARSMLLASLCHNVPLRSGYQLSYQLWSSGGKRCWTETVLIHADTIWLGFTLCSKLVLLSVDLESHGASYRHVSMDCTWSGEKMLRTKQDGQDYVHRIGRTGRAGRKGKAITLLRKGWTPRHTWAHTWRNNHGHTQTYQMRSSLYAKSLDVDVLLEP